MGRPNRNIVFLILAVLLVSWGVFLQLIPAIGGLWVILMFLAITAGVFVVLIKPIGR
jgi:hypothetical protein